jgi:hypothetical protein
MGDTRQIRPWCPSTQQRDSKRVTSDLVEFVTSKSSQGNIKPLLYLFPFWPALCMSVLTRDLILGIGHRTLEQLQGPRRRSAEVQKCITSIAQLNMVCDFITTAQLLGAFEAGRGLQAAAAGEGPDVGDAMAPDA